MTSVQVEQIYRTIDDNPGRSPDELGDLLGLNQNRIRFYLNMRKYGLHHRIMDATDDSATPILFNKSRTKLIGSSKRKKSNAELAGTPNEQSIEQKLPAYQPLPCLESFCKYLSLREIKTEDLAKAMKVKPNYFHRILEGKEEFTSELQKICLKKLGSNFETLEELMKYRK